MTDHSEQAAEQAETIINALLNGVSLRIAMTPDDAIPGNAPLHDEHFALPHVIIKNNIFFAITNDCLFIVPERDEPPVSFYYSNLKGIFGLFCPIKVFMRSDLQINFLISTQKRYKRHEWILKPVSALVWDIRDPDYPALRKAVKAGHKLTVVFQDEEDVWNIHPIGLPQINRENDGFILKSEYTIYPYLFRDPALLKQVIDTKMDADYFSDASKYRTFMTTFLHQPFIAFYHIGQDGKYKSYYDLRRGDTMSSYKDLKIFAEI